ncbi:MAG: isoleucine--tRNA ligase [Phycisphaerales bacterium]
MSEAPAKPNYRKTLNLPKTKFDMRARLKESEPMSRKRWEAMDLFESVDAARAEADPYVFHDGPPYANGSIHLGHLMNKILKDIVVRSRLMRGQRCRFVPGWDCHGLPIEHKVMSDLVASGRVEKLAALEPDVRRMAVRKACKAHAEKFVKQQSGELQRLLTLGDYKDPYVTMAPRYERATIEVFAELVEQGLVYRALKPVHWSIANQTALAEAELEYQDREDPSIYVDFEAADRSAVGKAFGVELDTTPSFMIWTTTPWTLPANLAIAVHERYRYALVRMDGSETVVASDLVKKVAETGGAEDVEILAECDGSALVGCTYRHPFCDRTSRIVSADYVTLEDGTGLVHTAPGHGTEDYQTGLREKLEVYCPVQHDGTYDDTVPEWLVGLSVWDANPLIIKHLQDSGHLFHHLQFMHSYPHDWRSKTPVIFRGTEQWFVGVDRPTKREGRTLREMAVTGAENDVKFIPEWGRNRFRGMLETRPDWCISRQRAWGLPIPAFRLPNGEALMTPATVRAVAEAFGERGSDAWFTETPEQILATWDPASDPDAPAGVDLSTLEKMYDIFDVWFESGSSWNAVMRRRDLGYPIDLYLEGSDQHRGWFQLSMLPALGATGKPPFKTILTHGFIVDKDGKKMSKSLGNTLDVGELLESHGADVLRWWVSQLAFENDIKVDTSYIDAAGESYRKVRNTVRFLLSNLNDFTATCDGVDGMCVDLSKLPAESIDAWILGEAAALREGVMAAYDACEMRRAHQMLFDFCNDTLSSVYLAAVKDRLYCDAADAPRRRATQTVMWDLTALLSTLLAPILPHTADEIWRSLHGINAQAKDDPTCVQMETYAGVPRVQASADWAAVFAGRDAALKALEAAKAEGVDNPLDAEVVLPDPDGVLMRFDADMADLLGVSRVAYDTTIDAPIVKSLEGEPRCERSWKRDGTVSERSNGSMLSDRDAAALELT